jgi:DNA-binding response OmpR family regulator
MTQDYSLLIIDDNEELREVLRQELVDEGYGVFAAGDGEEGLGLLRKEHIDLVLLDIRLPGMGGFEVLKVIKKEFPETRVVMITAHSDVYHAMESRRLGADDFVGKPYDLNEIVLTIDRLRGSSLS